MMPERRLSRREFLRLAAASLVLPFAAACGPEKEKIPTVPTVGHKRLIEADKEVLEERPYILNRDELDQVASLVGLKRIDISGHFSTEDEPPRDVWFVFLPDNSGKATELVVSLPINKKSTGWEVSRSFYEVIFAWAKANNPGEKKKFEEILRKKLNEITLNGPFRFKNEDLPLEPKPRLPQI